MAVARAREVLEMLSVMAVCGLLDLRYGDETAFSLKPNVPYGWGEVAKQQGIRCIRGGNLNVFGLLDLQSNCLTSYRTHGRVNSQQMIAWLDDFASTLVKTTIVVLDNAPWHRSAAFTAKLAEWEDRGMIIYYLPPYCPHLNPVEITWRQIKYQWLRPQDFINKEALHERVIHILTHFQQPEFYLNYREKLAG